jgi:hypothetical protein
MQTVRYLTCKSRKRGKRKIKKALGTEFQEC